MKNEYTNPLLSLLIFDEEDDVMTASVIQGTQIDKDDVSDSTHSSVSVSMENIKTWVLE